MACYDTSPYTCTYDSGGAGSLPGGDNPDYSSLSTWEAASDNDLSGYSGPVILDCYDSKTHAEDYGLHLGGASNTSSTIYRAVRSSANCATPWAGKKATGANFECIYSSFSIMENYGRVIDIYVSRTYANYTAVAAFEATGGHTGTLFLNCVATCTNTQTGYKGIGFWLSYLSAVQSHMAYNCIALDCSHDGFNCYDWNSGDKAAFINCTSINNGEYGFNCANGFGSTYAWNCYAANNTGGDFNESNWDSPSGWNASKDNTADLGGTAGDNYKNGLDLLTSGDIDSDGLATADDLYENGAAGARYGRNPYDDLTGTIDFNDFLKNDAAGEAISRLDIRGTARPSGTTADAAWNVGASQAAASSTITLTVADLTSGASLDGITVSPLLLEQEGFRFRNDDGRESAATWLANQDTSVELQPGDKVRLRFVINGSGDYGPAQFQLEYKKTTEGEWLRLVP